jgi:hypothetical protein
VCTPYGLVVCAAKRSLGLLTHYVSGPIPTRLSRRALAGAHVNTNSDCTPLVSGTRRPDGLVAVLPANTTAGRPGGGCYVSRVQQPPRDHHRSSSLALPSLLESGSATSSPPAVRPSAPSDPQVGLCSIMQNIVLVRQGLAWQPRQQSCMQGIRNLGANS